MHMTVTFMPFTRPAFDDDIETLPKKSGLTALLPFDAPPARTIVTNVSDFQKGLLTVKLIKASGLGLGAGSKKRSVDPYVQIVLTDCDPARPNETQSSGVKYNDNSPRWNEKFDFTFISAGSMVMVNVWDKTTLLEMLLSVKLSKQRFKDALLGKVMIPVADVVRNGHLRDTFPLQDAESGQIEMRLDWQNAYADDYM